MQCDASEKGLGATLLQGGQPVAFASRAVWPTEQHYAQIENECLAIVFGCGRFDHYLFGKDSITVETDHKPLEVIFKKPLLQAPKQLQRMLLRIQKYPLNVSYKRGAEMYIADLLSRASLPLEKTQCDTKEYQIFNLREETSFREELENIEPVEYISVSRQRLHQIQEMTKDDSTLQALNSMVLAGWPETKESVPVCIQGYFNFRDEITIHNGVLYKGLKIMVPEKMRQEMTMRAHASHLGIESCIRRARDALYWPDMTKDITEAVQNCITCQEFAPNQTREPLMTHEIPTYPWQKVGIDLFSCDKTDYLITCDYYSDFWEIDILKDTTT